ncbi:MAG: ABC transporter ATP-binding protein [Verrucomicrobiales bacterium]|nr:ABC transporter ATP-binding protein [Verrucomicrobiales bacterium]
MSDQDPILSFEDVTRQYRAQSAPAVGQVSLSIAHGQVLALIGESGSGKTTLLRLAAGLESPDGGRVLIDGNVVADAENQRKEVPPEKRQLGLVFQDGALFPHLNAFRNVSYGLRHCSQSEKAARVVECLELVDLSGKEKRFPHELSGGERQRLALARALAPSPKLLLLDEPFSHLDPALRRKLREEIHSILSRLGQTALMVTHDPEDALAIASRVAIMDRGNILQTGSPSEVYLEPVDQYCAERFGPANGVRDRESGNIRWRRPEDARWIPCDLAEEGDMVTVTSVRSMGPIWEVRVTPDSHAEDSWLCFLKEGGRIQPGERGRVAWRGSPAQVSWKS